MNLHPCFTQLRPTETKTPSCGENKIIYLVFVRCIKISSVNGFIVGLSDQTMLLFLAIIPALGGSLRRTSLPVRGVRHHGPTPAKPSQVALGEECCNPRENRR